jgi:hypothetical protein
VEKVRTQKSEPRRQKINKPQHRGHGETEIIETQEARRNAEKNTDVKVEWLGLGSIVG